MEWLVLSLAASLHAATLASAYLRWRDFAARPAVPDWRSPRYEGRIYRRPEGEVGWFPVRRVVAVRRVNWKKEGF